MVVTVAAAASAFAMVPLVIKIISFFFTEDTRQIDKREIIGVTLMLALGVATLALSATGIESSAAPYDVYNQHIAALKAASAARNRLYYRHRFAVQRYYVTDSPLVLYEFNVNYSTTAITSSYDALLATLRDNAVDISGLDQLMSELVAADLYLLHMQRVGLWLHNASARRQANVSAPPPSPPFLATYDFSQEAGSAEDATRYSTDAAYQYSTPAADFQRSASDLTMMARLAVTGQRAYARLFDAFNALNSGVIVGLLDSANRLLLAASERNAATLNAAMALSASALAIGVVVVCLPLLDAAAKLLLVVHKVVDDLVDALFAATLLRVRVALIAVSALLVVQFALAVVTTDMGVQASSIVRAARDREYLLVKSLTVALKVNATAAASNGMEMSLQLANLASVKQQLADARNTLYFAPSATSASYASVSSLSAAQKSLTFDGGAGSLDSQYLTWLSMLEMMLAIPPELRVTVNATNAMANRYSFKPAMISSVGAAAAALEGALYPLLSAIRASNAQYDVDMEAELHQSAAADAALFAATVVVVVLELLVVFQPFTTHLSDEERGTRLLLTMIPQSVREAVPKISLYLDSGTLIEEEDEQRVYTLCPHAVKFIDHWGRVDDSRACFALLDQSKAGQILITNTGTVVFANKRIPALLGYDDLVDRNVSVLMEEPLRSLHNGFLARFVADGVPRVVGRGRDVVALHQNGDRVHVYLQLREVPSFDGVQYILGQLNRYNAEDVKLGSTLETPTSPL